MEVESEDEEDEREARGDGHAPHLDQDTQLQDMDEVRGPGSLILRILVYVTLYNVNLWIYVFIFSQ